MASPTAQTARQVGAAFGRLRRADGDEDDLGRQYAVGQIGGEREPAVADVPLHQFEQARLVDRQLAADRSVAILRASLSMPTTSLPLSARQVAVTRPT